MCDTPKTKIFISYAHEDWGWRDRMQSHLGFLVNAGRVACYADTEMKPGDDWPDEIRRALGEAKIFVALISPNFAHSKVCNLNELATALKARAEGSMRIVPVLVEPVSLRLSPFERMEVLPLGPDKRAKAVSSWDDPNEPLSAVADAIADLIDGRVSLAGSVANLHVSSPPTLTNLPRRNSDWTGRVDQMSKLAAALQGGGTAAVCSLGGMGGVGKSSLAFEVAHRLGKNAFPDGILQFDLRGTDPEPLSAKALMSAVLLEIEPGQQLPEDVSSLYRQTLSSRKMLLILDNAKDAAQVVPMLPPEPVSVLITSRARIEPEHGTVVDLDLMEPDEAVALLSKELGDKASGIDLARLAELCGNLPLALHVAAGTIRGSRVRSAQSIMAGLAKNPGGDLKDVQAQLALSLDVLEADDDELYQHYLALGIMEASFTATMAAAVMGVEVDEVEAALEALTQRSLLMMAGDAAGPDEGDAPRFRLHDLLRGLAKHRWDEDAAHGAGLRHAGHCTALLIQCRDLEDQGGEAFMAALRLFDRERGHIEAGQRWLSSKWADDDAAATIAAAYPSIAPDVVNLRLHSRDQIAWFKMQAKAAQHSGDKQREGNALGNLGSAYARLGEPRCAIEYHEQQLAITREISGRRGEGNALANLGIAYADLGETSCAIEYYEQALTIVREIGDRRGESSTLGNLGNAYAGLGETSRAIKYHEQALEIDKLTGDLRGQADTLWNAALTHAELDEKDQAIEKAKAAWVIRRAIDDPNGPKVANWLRKRGIDPDRL